MRSPYRLSAIDGCHYDADAGGGGGSCCGRQSSPFPLIELVADCALPAASDRSLIVCRSSRGGSELSDQGFVVLRGGALLMD